MDKQIHKFCRLTLTKVMCMCEEEVTCSRRSSNCTYRCRFVMDHYSEGIVCGVHHTTCNLHGIQSKCSNIYRCRPHHQKIKNNNDEVTPIKLQSS